MNEPEPDMGGTTLDLSEAGDVQKMRALLAFVAEVLDEAGGPVLIDETTLTAADARRFGKLISAGVVKACERRGGLGAGDVEVHLMAPRPIEDQTLIDLCQQVYDGNWDDLVADFNVRLCSKPVDPRLFEKIKEDLGRIERIRLERATTI